MKEKKEKRYLKPGVASIFVAFVILSVLLLFLFAIGIPFLMSVNTQFYEMGERMLTDPNVQASIANIQDEPTRTQIGLVFNNSTGSIADTVDILGTFFQYGWLIIIVIVVFFLFIRTRVLVETQQSVF